MYKVSIILPVYNVEDYIEVTINSIINQTMNFDDIEVILINDASTDKSGEILDRLSYRYNNVLVIHLDNNSGACGGPRNVGIKYARGEYIIFADPDDIFNDCSCKTLYDIANEDNSDIVIGSFECFSDTGVYKHDIYSNELKYKSKINDITEKPELLNAPFNMMCKLFKSEFIRKNNLLFSEKVASQDALFTTEALMLSNSISYTPQSIFKYRIRTDKNNKSVTQKKGIKYFKDFLYIRERIIKIYNYYNKLDYIESRYKKDLRWVIYQLITSDTLCRDDLIEIIEDIQWFINIYIDNKMNFFDNMIEEIILSISKKDINNTVYRIEMARDKVITEINSSFK